MIAEITEIFQVILVSFMVFIVAVIIISPIILFYWTRKIKKLSKKVPEDMDERILKEKERIREVENEREKKRNARDKRRRIRIGEIKEERRDVENGDRRNEGEGKSNPEGIQVPRPSSEGEDVTTTDSDESTIELHRPATL